MGSTGYSPAHQSTTHPEKVAGLMLVAAALAVALLLVFTSMHKHAVLKGTIHATGQTQPAANLAHSAAGAVQLQAREDAAGNL